MACHRTHHRGPAAKLLPRPHVQLAFHCRDRHVGHWTQSVPFGNHCRITSFMFSCVPSSRRLQNRAKHTSYPSIPLICLWQANTFPSSELAPTIGQCGKCILGSNYQPGRRFAVNAVRCPPIECKCVKNGFFRTDYFECEREASHRPASLGELLIDPLRVFMVCPA